MSVEIVEKAVAFFLNRTTWLMLIWSNIIAVVLYNVAVQEVQNLLSGSLPGDYSSHLWKLIAVLLKVNNAIFNFIWIGFVIWRIFEIPSSRTWCIDIAQKLLNGEIVKKIYLLCMLAYIMIGNVIVGCSLILTFFFQDLLLFQSMLTTEGEAFSLQYPASFLTWPTFVIGAWCAISSWNKERNINEGK